MFIHHSYIDRGMCVCVCGWGVCFSIMPSCVIDEWMNFMIDDFESHGEHSCSIAYEKYDPVQSPDSQYPTYQTCVL